MHGAAVTPWHEVRCQTVSSNRGHPHLQNRHMRKGERRKSHAKKSPLPAVSRIAPASQQPPRHPHLPLLCPLPPPPAASSSSRAAAVSSRASSSGQARDPTLSSSSAAAALQRSRIDPRRPRSGGHELESGAARWSLAKRRCRTDGGSQVGPLPADCCCPRARGVAGASTPRAPPPCSAVPRGGPTMRPPRQRALTTGPAAYRRRRRGLHGGSTTTPWRAQRGTAALTSHARPPRQRQESDPARLRAWGH
jgi:hypothetical protein